MGNWKRKPEGFGYIAIAYYKYGRIDEVIDTLGEADPLVRKYPFSVQWASRPSFTVSYAF